MQYCLARAEVEAERAPGESMAVLTLFDDARGCGKFAQRVLSFPGGGDVRLAGGDSDEVLFVLAGEGAITVSGSRKPVAEGVAVYVSHGTPWAVEAEPGLELLSVLVHDPLPVEHGMHAFVDVGAAARGSATASRQFGLGVCPDAGCPSVTQFVGFVPPGRAPDHFHRYDEVIYVLEGTGALHIDGEAAPLGPGSCVHLPARLVHCLENTGETELRLLGVFRPAGSPAEAYYPDGRPAVYPEGS